MNRMRIVLGLAAFCGMVGSGFADEAVWVNLSDKTPLWSELSNWTDGGGGPLTSIPTGTTYNVSFPDAPVGVTRQTVKLDVFMNTSDVSLNTTAIGAVSDAANTPGEDWSRRLILLDNKNYASVLDREGRLTVGNPDAFHGYWSFSYSLGRLTLPATPVYTPKLSAISAKARPEIEVADADAKARLGSVFEDGAVRKIGAGELEVAQTTGGGTRFYVSEGGLTLEGVAPASEPEAGDDLPVAGAAFHLDATIPRTLVTTNETARETGRTFVTRWSDVRDNGMYAYYDENQTWSQSHLIPYANAPFLNTTDVSGRTFVDFGRNNTAQDEGYGPTNCLLRFSETLTNCREVFLVASKITSSASTAPVGDSNVNPFHSGGASTLVSETYAPDVRYGFILINGEVTGNDAAWPAHKSVEETQLGVISFASTNRVILSTLATDRFYADRSGGWRLGEVVIYTNVLTTAERYAVHQHLRRKWQGSDAADVGAVVLNPGASISVPEGRTARVTEVTAVDGTLVKTGAGTLEVGALSAKTAETVKSLDIRGGAVKVTGLPAVSDTEPAAGALLWLDANVRSSFVFTNETGTTDYVDKWYDCRSEQRTVYAQRPGPSGVAGSTGRDLVEGDGDVPTRIENAVGSLAAVDFGIYNGQKAGGNSFLILNTPGYSTDNAYEAFLVQSSTKINRAAIFGYGTGVSMIRSTSLMTQLLNDSSYGSYLGRNAVMTFNGVQVDPCASGQAALAQNTFDVYSVSAQARLPLTLVGGKDRIGQNSSFGGCRVGELILYDRKLTPAERRQTIAYLMKKWQGRTPQFAADGVLPSRLTFAADIPAILDSDADLQVESFTGSNGSIVKRGVGTVTLPAATLASAGAVTVEEGTLVTTFVSELDLPQPRYRYDASEETTFIEKYVSEGTTFVTAISSLGTSATSLSTGKGKTGGAVTNPALETAEMRTGVNRPCFNLGQRGGSNNNGTGPTCFQSGSLLATTLAEYHVIVADNVAEVSPLYQNLFSNINNPAQYFTRNSQQLLADNSAEALRNGYLAVDGEEKVYTDNLPAGFHLFSAVPTEPLPVGYLCMARDGAVGGLKVAEMLVYDATNSVEHRAYIQNQLMHKWFNAPAPKWEFPVASVSVAEGAMWRDTSTNMIHTVGTLALGGTADVDEMTVNESLTLSGAVAVTGDLTLADGIEISLTVTDAALSVGGTLTFAGAATIVLDDAAFSQLGTGDRVLFSAAEIVGFNRNAVTLDASGIPAKRSFSLVETVDAASGKTTAIRLRVSIPGMTIIVR